MSRSEAAVVRRLLPGEAARAAAVLTAGNSDYPAFRALFPDPVLRRRALHAVMAASARDAIAHGRPMTADEAGRMVAVALWMPPGTFPPGLFRRLRWTAAVARILPMTGPGGIGLIKYSATLDAALPGRPFWYLRELGVRPDAQGTGIGDRLVRAGLAEADAAGHECRLHTSDPANLDFYRRFGFAVSDSRIQAGRNGPVHLGLTRPAHGG